MRNDQVGVPEPPTPVNEQLIIFAKELGELYRIERRQSGALQEAMDALAATHAATIDTLTAVVGAKDHTSRPQLNRMQHLGLALARAVDPALADAPEVGFGFLLHDIGKIGVHENILGKEGPLSDDEWQVMRQHPELGADIVAPMSFLGEAVLIIRHHHERFDGEGYPSGLAGEEIPLAARVFAVVDAFDAMTSDRPYRAALPLERVIDEIALGRGSQFDPAVADVFLGLIADDAIDLFPAESAEPG